MPYLLQKISYNFRLTCFHIWYNNFAFRKRYNKKLEMELNEYHKKRNIEMVKIVKEQQKNPLTIEQVKEQFKRINDSIDVEKREKMLIKMRERRKSK